MTARASLDRVALFDALGGAERDALAARLRERRHEAGDEVIHQGDRGTEFFIIIAGSLEIRIDGRPVNVLGPGAFLGELALLFGAPRNASAVALEPAALLVMDQADFNSLLAEHPEIESKVLAVVAQRMRYR